MHASFQLIVHKYFDAKFALDSVIVFVLANLATREQCEKLFQSILDALQKGENAFHVDQYLEKQQRNAKDSAYN